MSEGRAPQVIAADRFHGDVIIEFADGSGGLYSSELLYAALSQALPLKTATTEQLPDDQSKDS